MLLSGFSAKSRRTDVCFKLKTNHLICWSSVKISFLTHIIRTCRFYFLIIIIVKKQTFTQQLDIFIHFKAGLPPPMLACYFPIIIRPFIHSTLPWAGQQNQQHQPVSFPLFIPRGACCYFSILHSSRNRKLCIQAIATVTESIPAADTQQTFDSSLIPVWLADLTGSDSL